MNDERLFREIDYLGSLDEYLAFVEEHFDLEPNEILLELGERLEKIEPITWEEILAQDGMEGIWEEDLAKKRRPQDYLKGTFHLDDHFRGKSSHKDIRIKMNDHLYGWTITDAVEGAIDERVDSLSDCRKYPWSDSKIFKFQPDMGDRNVKSVAIKKSTQPLVWLNVRNVAFPPGSVGATKLEWGVFRAVDDGLAYQGTQKPYFNEWFLKGKHFKGRLIFRLIPVRPEWKKKPKARLQWQTWLAASTPKGQLPYLLSPRGRSRKDVAPPEGESWLPPEWEAKIKSEFRWWPDSKSKQAKIKLIDEAYNDLIERGAIKARKLKLWQEGEIVKGGLARIPHGNYLPKKLLDKLKNSKDLFSKWVLGSPYALLDDAPEEVKKWAAEMREGLFSHSPYFIDLQTDTAVILMGYGELKAKGWKDEKIIEEIAKNLLPIGFDLVYWRKKVREVLKNHGITIKKAMDTQTAGEGHEWIPEDYARRMKRKIRIHQVNLWEMRELKKAKFLLRLHHWKGQFVVRGMSVEHWDLVLDKGEKCLDEFAGMMNNPLEYPEGVNCIRHPCCIGTPERKPNKEWMNFVGKSIPPNHPEWGNPNKRIPAYMDRVDAGSVNIISDTNTFVSFMFKGKKLKGYWIAKRESPRSENWVFSKSSLPGEPRKETEHARHRRDKCMECDKPPIYEVLWAEGMGHAWLCKRHFGAWATKGDGKGEVCSLKEVKNGIAAKKFQDNPNPNIWEKLKRELS